MNMPDYKTMYRILFQAMALCIRILQKAQQDAEELYISADEPIQLHHPDKEERCDIPK